jgi:CHASE3 domain sensor protein
VFLSGALVVGTVFWERPDLAARLVGNNADLDRISRSVKKIRDVVDSMRETRGAERAYLLTGSQEERAAYYTLVQSVSKSRENLDMASADQEAWVRFNVVADRLLADLAQGAALQDAGRHEEAVAASNIGISRKLFAGIDGITRERIADLRGQYLTVVDDIRAAGDASDQLARGMMGLVGASFALGCIGLVTYFRRHLSSTFRISRGEAESLHESI